METINYKKALSKCIRCGACKTSCPTYHEELDESMCARGRIALLNALSQRKLTPSKELTDKIFSCLLCGACTTRCSSGIPIEDLFHFGRRRLMNENSQLQMLRKTVKIAFFHSDSAATMLRNIQSAPYLSLLKIKQIHHIPSIAKKPFLKRAEFKKKGIFGRNKIGRVTIFTGCIINYMYPHLAWALFNTLLTLGYEIIIHREEVCCGSPLQSLGMTKEAAAMTNKNMTLFSNTETDAILTLCPTCTETLQKEYPKLTGKPMENVFDVNQFFVQQDLPFEFRMQKKVIYHDPCHLRYHLGVYSEPREILNAIEGIELIEADNGISCCGFGGLFSFTFQELSTLIGEKRINRYKNLYADSLVTSCPGCIMQLEGLAKRNNIHLEVKHIIELIAEALTNKNQLCGYNN